jgi:vacuolar-type H+-ATPase subunit E/Vma4
MPINEMLDALEQDGKEACQKILSDARAEAKRIIEEIEEAGAEREKALLAETKKKLEKERSKAFKKSNFSVNKIITEKKEELIETLFNKLEDDIKAKLTSSDSPDIFKKLAVEAIACLKTSQKEIIVSVNKKDIDSAKKVLGELNVQYSIDDGLDTVGGLKVKSFDGKIAVDNTFESRANKAKQLLKSEINNLLFGVK